MMGTHLHTQELLPITKADAVLTQANPVSGTKYTVLATTRNVEIISIMAAVTWTVQPTPLEVHVTIDGVVYTFSKANPVSASGYFARLRGDNAESSMELTTTDYLLNYQRPLLLKGKSVKVEAETTGGTTSQLLCRLKYRQMT